MKRPMNFITAYNKHLHLMTSIEKLSNFATQANQTIIKRTQMAFSQLVNQLEQIEIDMPDSEIDASIHTDPQDRHQAVQNQPQQEKFEGLDELQLLESRAVANKNESNSSAKVEKVKKRRIKQIQDEKRKIAEQLKQIDNQISQIKGKTNNEKLFNKHSKIQKDQNAQKQAQLLVKQLKSQRKQMEVRKRQQFQKSLIQMQKQDEQRRKLREQELLRNKQQRREAILQRMEEERKKRQRRLIQVQSNQLIVKLKKQEQLQRVASMAPSQIVEVDHKKRALQKKTNFNLHEIEEHDRKYRQFKVKQKKQKQERAQSLKVNREYQSHKYSKNIWIERIEQQQQRKKEQDKQNEQRRRVQLEKRLKYGQLVKNIFLPKRKQKQNDADQVRESNQINYNQTKTQDKPRTPQQVPNLPKVKTVKNRTQNAKMFRQQSLPGIRNNRKSIAENNENVKEFDPVDEQKQKVRKQRQLELRKQTKQRLKKLQSQSLNKDKNQDQRVKYKNYLGQVKVKKDQANDWKKIMNSDKLTEEQKYQQIIKKAQNLEAKARKKEDKVNNRDTDEDAVNLYIGSIQAKLALLQKF